MLALDAITRSARALVRRLSGRPHIAAKSTPQPQTYARWIAEYDTLTAADRQTIGKESERLRVKPLLSLIVTVDGATSDDVVRTLKSIRAQLYPAWEAYVLAPAHKDGADSRMHYREGGALVDAIRQARGDYLAVVEAGDLLPPHALFVMAHELNLHPDADFIYSDEDQLDHNGQRSAPYFKSDWNPDLFLGQDYACRLSLMRSDSIRRTLPADEDSPDSYSLALRMIDGETVVRHVPFILYHRKARTTSADVLERHRLAVENDLRRRSAARAPSVSLSDSGQRHVAWPLPEPEPMVSLIIPTRDRIDLIKVCIEGLRHHTAYPNLEIIVVDNNSVEPQTVNYFDEIRSDPRVRILPYSVPFNFSAINNLAAMRARGEVIGFLNNDIKVIEPGWLREMVGHVIRPDVGAVGAMLYYGDDTIQHAGVVLGIGGIASHIFKRQPKDSPGYAGRAQLVQDLSAVTAACMLVRRAVFEEVGGLDEQNLTVAYNDVDLCLRIRQAGYRIVWTPFARLYHLESATRGGDRSDANRPRFEREKAHMLKRWGAVLKSDPYYNPNLALDRVDCRPAFPPRVTPPWKRPT